MNVYLAVWRDRHTDDDYAIFEELGDAIAWMREYVAEYAGEPYYGLELFTENLPPDDEKDLGWIQDGLSEGFWAAYACSTEMDDGPSGYVVERRVM